MVKFRSWCQGQMVARVDYHSVRCCECQPGPQRCDMGSNNNGSRKCWQDIGQDMLYWMTVDGADAHWRDPFMMLFMIFFIKQRMVQKPVNETKFC